MQKLGKNINGYLGERIELTAVQRESAAIATTHGWATEEVHPAPRRILGFVRHSGRPANEVLRVYLSSGIHGDEPAGPLAIRQLLHENNWPAELDLWMCPWLNPTGFALGKRENQEGLDLNRQYLAPKAAETAAHIAWLDRQPRFDLCLCLHEDWESHGFYVYEQNPDHQASLAEAMIQSVAQVCPIDRSEVIEGRVARDGIIRPNIDPRERPDWPEAFYLITSKTRLSYTLEAPSDFRLQTRVAALVAAVNAALKAFVQTRTRPA